MLFAAKNYGSRGSAYVLDGDDFMQRKPMEENAEGRGYAVVLEGESVGAIKVKPLPQRDLWFESVWADYRKRWEE